MIELTLEIQFISSSVSDNLYIYTVKRILHIFLHQQCSKTIDFDGVIHVYLCDIPRTVYYRVFYKSCITGL